MKRLAFFLLFAFAGLPLSRGQVPTAPLDPPGSYLVDGPNGQAWHMDSTPVCDDQSGQDQQALNVTFGRYGASPGDKSWLIEPGDSGGYTAYGPHGQTWTNDAGSGAVSSGSGPDGQIWVSWQTSLGARVTYQNGRMWVSSRAGGTSAPELSTGIYQRTW